MSTTTSESPSMPPTPSRAVLAQLIHRITQGGSPLQFVHLPHPKWPLSQGTNDNFSGNDNDVVVPPTRPLRIAVFDSSFNPPTRAHQAMVSARTPSGLWSRDSSANSNSSAEEPTLDPTAGEEDHNQDYDARLLLLSVKNADKELKAGDVGYEERMEMMRIMARDIEEEIVSAAGQSPVPVPHGNSLPSAPDRTPHRSPSAPRQANIAIALIATPFFTSKSTILNGALTTRLSDLLIAQAKSHYPPLAMRGAPVIGDDETEAPAKKDDDEGHDPNTSGGDGNATGELGTTTVPPPQCVFLLGADTLERLFAPRYYGPATDADKDGLTNEERMMGQLERMLSDEYSTGDAARVVCARRVMSGSQRGKNEDEVPEEAKRFVEGGKIMMLDIGLDEQTYSSSAVRAGVAKGAEQGDWKKMVSPRIASYIAQHRLYIPN